MKKLAIKTAWLLLCPALYLLWDALLPFCAFIRFKAKVIFRKNRFNYE
ncbi:hypothetical protein [Bradyrhizobium erythrophlei]|uniref:Uncharacterized protein n=1 Tax=Bradyrhizobium erythrophlei TaxID=1437360 RepID=A0A1M5NLY9_9BRAD|nr:hypothetical protein [Bradyrhizobium erythrophlei]SHG90229.1 hypothetical protein SAMN05443248_3037 [Bradyrhizobium erythrophlei]